MRAPRCVIDHDRERLEGFFARGLEGGGDNGLGSFQGEFGHCGSSIDMFLHERRARFSAGSGVLRAASHVATALRSSRVISVMLLGGMAWVSTLWTRMISAWRAISSGRVEMHALRRGGDARPRPARPHGTWSSATGSRAPPRRRRRRRSRASRRSERSAMVGVAGLADDREPDRDRDAVARRRPRSTRASPCRHAAS